jgi:hypothetical protein
VEYVFTGFRQVDGMRFYGFQGISADRSRQPYTVATDVTLLRMYAIALQDVPLLCRRFLEEREGRDGRHSIILGEADMRRHVDQKAADLVERAARKRKPNSAAVSIKIR